MIARSPAYDLKCRSIYPLLWQAYWGTLARSQRELSNANLVSGTSEEIGNLFAGADLAVVNRQFPAEPLQWLPQTLRLPWEEGMRLLQEAGFQACHPASEAVTSMESHLALTAALLTSNQKKKQQFSNRQACNVQASPKLSVLSCNAFGQC